MARTMPKAMIAEESERRIFMEQSGGPRQIPRTLKDYGKHGIASRENCIARTPEKYGKRRQVNGFGQRNQARPPLSSRIGAPPVRDEAGITRRKTPSRCRPEAAGRAGKPAFPA